MSDSAEEKLRALRDLEKYESFEHSDLDRRTRKMLGRNADAEDHELVKEEFDERRKKLLY